jgi:myo-inositol 2-dehydrogenase/D-chiro-inositol 1-dehydrogenase
MLRIGLLGCGRIGQVHAMTLRGVEGACLAAVSDAVPAAAQALGERYTVPVMTSHDLIASAMSMPWRSARPPQPITTSSTRLPLLAKRSSAKSPSIFQPSARAQCIAAVEAAGVPFMTAFNRRFDPSFAHLESQLRAGTIGDVELVTILSRDPSPPPVSYIEQSGGLFRDMMIHDFDMARFLLGEEPVRVHAVGASLVDPAIGDAGDVDTAAVTLQTASGRICQISNSRRATYGYDQRIEVHGSKGLLKGENQLEHAVVRANADGFVSAPAQHFFLERYARAYAREMEHFVAAVQGGTTPSPSIHDGLRAQMLADAAQASLNSGQQVTIDA